MVDGIFKLRDVIDEFDPEIMRLQEVWSAEMIRLYEEDLTGVTSPKLGRAARRRGGHA
jgi:hypothetical protein